MLIIVLSLFVKLNLFFVLFFHLVNLTRLQRKCTTFPLISFSFVNQRQIKIGVWCIHFIIFSYLILLRLVHFPDPFSEQWALLCCNFRFWTSSHKTIGHRFILSWKKICFERNDYVVLSFGFFNIPCYYTNLLIFLNFFKGIGTSQIRSKHIFKPALSLNFFLTWSLYDSVGIEACRIVMWLNWVFGQTSFGCVEISISSRICL